MGPFQFLDVLSVNLEFPRLLMWRYRSDELRCWANKALELLWVHQQAGNSMTMYHDIPWYTQDSRYFLSQTQSAESITYFYHSCCRKGAVVFQATPWTWSMKNSWHGRLLSWQGISMYIISIHIPIYPHNPEIPAPISYTNIQKIDIVHFLKNDIPMVSRCTPFFQVAFIMSVHIAEAWKVLSWSHGVFFGFPWWIFSMCYGRMIY